MHDMLGTGSSNPISTCFVALKVQELGLTEQLDIQTSQQCDTYSMPWTLAVDQGAVTPHQICPSCAPCPHV